MGKTKKVAQTSTPHPGTTCQVHTSIKNKGNVQKRAPRIPNQRALAKCDDFIFWWSLSCSHPIIQEFRITLYLFSANFQNSVFTLNFIQICYRKIMAIIEGQLCWKGRIWKKLIALLLFSGLALTACSSIRPMLTSSSSKERQMTAISSREKDQKKIEQEQKKLWTTAKISTMPWLI